MKKLSKKRKKAVVAMSGGVDSSVAAALMLEKGYDVIGMSMQLYDDKIKRKNNSKSCCAGQDIYDAKRVADKLKINHYVLNFEKNFFKDVIKDFADTYAIGKTPIPCIRCNEKMKFKDLLDTAISLDADILATGHYAKIQKEKGTVSLYRANDKEKDQSYFLFSTPLDLLKNIAFPLGNLTKYETRQYAKKFNLPVSNKPESQDICFVQSTKKGAYREIVQKLRPDVTKSGEIIHLNGTKLGKHNGIDAFTIGQRRGLGVNSNSGKPLYVIKIDPVDRNVFVGEEKFLMISKFRSVDVTWLIDVKVGQKINAKVKVRSQHEPADAKIIIENINSAIITFKNPCLGVALGQASVFYDNDQVLGGGWINENIY